MAREKRTRGRKRKMRLTQMWRERQKTNYIKTHGVRNTGLMDTIYLIRREEGRRNKTDKKTDRKEAREKVRLRSA